MNENVIRPHGGIAIHERLPALSGVHRYKEAELGAGEEKRFVLRILAHHLYVAARRQIAAHTRERLAVVMGDEDVRMEIVRAVSVDRDVGGCGVGMRWLDPRDPIGIGPVEGVLS